MKSNMLMRFVLATWLFALAVGTTNAQETSPQYRISPAELGLPDGTRRTSEPFVTRIYKVNEAEKIIDQQPDGFPFTIERDYQLAADETSRTHQGVDFSSRPSPTTKPAPMDFRAGLHGVVLKAGDGLWGTITVQIYDGTLIQYLHTLASHVKVGDIVAPETVLGITGRKGTGVIHLHIQARDKFGNVISPDLAFHTRQREVKLSAVEGR